MASVQKFPATAVSVQLRHIDREIVHPSNQDIDTTRTHFNYALSPDRGMREYDYYKQRLGELYCYNRSDVKTMAGWVVTAPQDVAPASQEQFFRVSYDFLADRYGQENVVKAVVHLDEAKPHMHFYFIPVAPDINPRHLQTEKVCANDVLNRRELGQFHSEWEKHLQTNGVHATVRSGITQDKGGNRTVWELKQEREINYSKELRF